MTYLSWAAMHEGPTDRAYVDVLIPNLLEDIVMRRGTRNVTVPANPAVVLGNHGRAVDNVASEICSESEAFYLVFIHADTGGRGLQAGLAGRSEAYVQAAFDLCNFPMERCIIIAPKHETEAWMLADCDSVASALGYRGNVNDLGLPSNAAAAEKLVDPKAVLNQAIQQVRGRRARPNVHQFIAAIAQRQDLDRLRESESFRSFEAGLTNALTTMGCIA